MKNSNLAKQILIPLLLCISVLVTTSCAKENLHENEHDIQNYEQSLQDSEGSLNSPLMSLEINENTESITRGPTELYFCSEVIGGYTSQLYVKHDVYISEFYMPDGINSNSSRYATWMSNLESWLDHDFNDPNPSGSNSYSIFMSFVIYNVNGDIIIDAVEANRAYNEFVCQLMEQLSISNVNDIDNFELDLDILIDYQLCGCNNPTVDVTGTAYY